MSKAIVTGGGGFIGSNLVDKLVEIYDKVIIIDNESADSNEYVTIKTHVHFMME